MTGASSITGPSNCSDGSSAPATSGTPASASTSTPGCTPASGSVTRWSAIVCTSSTATTGTWSSNASNAAVAAPLAQTLLAWSSTTASAPVEGTAMDSDSETTGIRLLTSTLVTSVRWASAIACPGSAAYAAAASGSRTNDITKSSSEF